MRIQIKIMWHRLNFDAHAAVNVDNGGLTDLDGQK